MKTQLRKIIIRIFDRRWEIFWAIVLLVFVGVFVCGLLSWLYYTTFIDPGSGIVP